MGMLVGIVAGMDEGLPEVFRRIVACHGTLVGAWTVVPPDAHMWVIWDGEGCVQSSPFLHGSFGYLLVVLVHPQIVCKLVMRAAVESQLSNEFVGRNFGLVAV